jgi:threonine aldolase
MNPLDFRSDTVTRPTPGMRAAMAAAEVGDDVFGEDPTVNRLQERVAQLLGKEAALLVPTGSMANLIGVSVHCRPGDEMLCEVNSHVLFYEQGGYARIAGVAARTVEGDNGVIRLEQIAGLVRPDNPHMSRTRLVWLENTHNRGGGKILPYDVVTAICDWAKSKGLARHLDGARLLNAAVASGIPAAQWAGHFDTASICFSKGLGAPVGSAIAGPRDLIRDALRMRKVLGGGMRQSGVLAAAAIYALDHHVERLADDHANCRRLADGIRAIPGLRLVADQFDTNLLFFDVEPRLGTAEAFVGRLKQRGLLVLSTGAQRIRMVTHLDVNSGDADRAIEILAQAAAED